MPQSSEQRLLFAIVLLLFGLQLTLMGGGAIGFVLDLFAVLLAVSAVQPNRRS